MHESGTEGLVVDSLTVGPFQENTYFLRRADHREVVVIDPGDEDTRLVDLIESHGWQPVAIVNTHAHLDHIGAVNSLKKRYQIPFYLHADDRPTLAQTPAAAALYGVSIPVVPAVDFDLEDGQSLELAGLGMQVFWTPGHTPGHVSLVLPDRVFAGDVLFHDSIGRTDLPGGDAPTLLRSIRERLLPLPDDTIVHAGHGPDTTIGRERLHNPFLQHLDLLEGQR